jgi:cbb3-type cytochrome oxidase subunit 3
MFEGSPLMVLPLVTLFLFFITFLFVGVRAYARRARDYDDVAALPLKDDEGDRS